MLSENKRNFFFGILFIALITEIAFFIAEIPAVKALSLSPLIVGLLLGIIYANTLRKFTPTSWAPGVAFCSKKILRLGIILYGFRLTFGQIIDVGIPALMVDAIIVSVTLVGGYFIGAKCMKMDKETALLTSCGSAICGAAAVLGAEAAIKSKPYKTAVAVSTVVLFGTLAMFLYPILYRNGILHLSPENTGLYIGSTIHEVAHAVGAGNATGDAVIAANAIVVKMIRVMFLVPVLLVLAFFVAGRLKSDDEKGDSANTKRKIAVPWFAFGFLAVVIFNSFGLFGTGLLKGIETVDTFFLSMAMTALGTETSLDKFKQAGPKPFILATILFVWLVFGGYGLAYALGA
ncbi:MAG: YeiH family protein [Hallerella porci]|uniref:Integral membrane protein (TIGR00698 family) n=1 Tax=Hallerella porci TaxID=1945871 RepID=A0ABX5LL97_9BACT|nr:MULTISPECIES: YeiH family protein [Hallerella]MCI5599946.1 YeiH family protein [Hallerella sp.]MDY3921954.1 YeiH family protein [Hallerella porci]PWL03204.1 putative integral membrane protein (TIGR00698 family) [Hallerella porci]